MCWYSLFIWPYRFQNKPSCHSYINVCKRLNFKQEEYFTWKISSLCDSKECSFSFRFLKSQRATVCEWERGVTLNYQTFFLTVITWQLQLLRYLVCRASSKNELAVWVKWQTVDLCSVGIYCMAGFGGVVWTSVPAGMTRDRVITYLQCCGEIIKKRQMSCQTYEAPYIMSFWSSATDPNSDSWSKCQETSSTTAVWPVKMVLASTIFPSFGTALMSHRQIVYSLRKDEK